MNKHNLFIPLFILSITFSMAGTASARENEDRGNSGSGSIDVRLNSSVRGSDDNGTMLDVKLRGDGTVDDNDRNRGNTPNNQMDRKDDSSKVSFSADFSARFDRVINRLNAIQARLTKVADRIDSRIEKAGSNVDTSASVKLVASARQEIKLASDSIAQANDAYKAESSSGVTVDASNYKSAYAKTLTHIKEAKQHFVEAHRNLVRAISSLKPGINTDIRSNTSAEIKVN